MELISETSNVEGAGEMVGNYYECLLVGWQRDDVPKCYIEDDANDSGNVVFDDYLDIPTYIRRGVDLSLI